mgnify:CR=1 FL=1
MRRDGERLALFAAHRRELVAFATGIVGDRFHAEDVVQEAWLHFDAAAAETRVEAPLGYLFRIVRNLAVDRLRRARRERARFAPGDPAGTAGSVAADAPSPETEAIDRDALAALEAALAELPERTRIALEMHRFGGCRLKEIADRLGVSVTTAHTLVAEGVAHCRRRLKRS